MPELKPTFQPSDVEIIDNTRVFNGFFKMDRYSVRHKRFAGGWSDVFERELFERGEAAAVLLYDVERDKVVLTEQFRIGAVKGSDSSTNQAPESPWMLEVVAGIIEAGEEPESVARREAVEEAGCLPNKLIPISCYWPSPGGCSEKIHLYCALVDSSSLGGIHGLEEENEDIYAHVVDFDLAYDGIASGVINNAATIIGLQWLKLNKSQFEK